MAVFGPALAPYSWTQQSGPVYAPPSIRTLARDGRQRRRRVERDALRRSDLVDRRLRGGVRRDDRGRRHRDRGGLHGWRHRRRAHAHHRLLPGDPRPRVDDRRRDRVRPQPVARDPGDRPAAVDIDRADRPIAGEEHPRARVRAARALPGGEPPSHRRPAHPAAGRPAADRDHRAHDRVRDLRRVGPGVPRRGRPRRLVGHDARARLRRARP